MPCGIVNKTRVDEKICGYAWTPFGGVIGTSPQAESFGIVLACLLAKKIKSTYKNIAIEIQTDSQNWAGQKDTGGGGNGWRVQVFGSCGAKTRNEIIRNLFLKLNPITNATAPESKDNEFPIQWIPRTSNKDADDYSKAAIPKVQPDEDHNIRVSFNENNLLNWGYTDPTQPTP